jgi:hypothetical protein
LHNVNNGLRPRGFDYFNKIILLIAL